MIGVFVTIYKGGLWEDDLHVCALWPLTIGMNSVKSFHA